MSFVIRLDVLSGTRAGSFEVVALAGEEAISELFSFRVVFKVAVTHGDAAEADAFAREVLGQRAVVAIAARTSDGTVRSAQRRYGIVSAVHGARIVGTGAERRLRVECTLLPRAYWLSLRKRSRVFSDMLVHEIAGKIFTEHKIPHRWSLRRTYPRRQYSVQYQETDLAFVTRLFADEGIAFYFEHRPTEAELQAAAERGGGSTLDENLDTAGAAIGVVGTLHSALGGVAGQGWLSMAGGITSLAGDALRGPERDPDEVEAVVIGDGGVDPAGVLGDVLCFVDDAGAYVRRYPDDPVERDVTVALQLERAEGLEDDDVAAWDFARTQRVATAGVELRDHDFRKPLLVLLAQDGATGAEALEAYDHHGQHDPPYVTGEEAKARLEQYRADADTATGRTRSPRILPGHVFRLDALAPRDEADEVPHALIQGGDYATIRVRHAWFDTGEDPTALGWPGLAGRSGRTADNDPVPAAIELSRYAGEVECVPATLLHRPRVEPRAPRATAETAIVVGPYGDEIHTDRHGRVKVQFHWDREGKFNPESSCFVRVAQPWAGAGYGFQFVPRVGQEVLVTFLGGDPDRPVITGSLYDGTHPTPEPLPERATRSAIRTQSSPGGGGFNELVFEDKKGEERLTLRAQAALEEVAKGPHTLMVGEEQRVLVSGDQQVGVGGEQSLQVGGRQTLAVGEDRSDSVGGSVSGFVGEHRNERVGGTAFSSVGGASVRVTGGDELGSVRGSHSLDVRGNSITQVGRVHDGAVSGNAVVITRGSAYLSAEKSISIQGLTSDGDTPSKIRLAVGGSYLEIGPEDITLVTKSITLVGSTSLVAMGSSQMMVLDDNGGVTTASPLKLQNSDGSAVHLDGGTALLTGSSEAKVRASNISLKSDSGGADSSSESDDKQPPEDNLEIELTHSNFLIEGEEDDPDFSPIRLPNLPCRVIFDDGTVIPEKRLASSVLKLYVPEEVKELKVEVRTNADDNLHVRYPHGIHFLVKLLEDDVPASTAAEGQRIRLRNLGYGTGLEPIEGTELDETTAAAVERFQREHDLWDLAARRLQDQGTEAPTITQIEGELATLTATRLGKVFGDA
jgi:type VI secretion system secreted protein VgrG